MARLQIILTGAPKSGIGAFMPSPYAVTTPAASSQGVLRVVGYPGNRQVPSPAPPALDDGELGGPYNQPSRVAPDYILPSLYWTPISRKTTGLAPTASSNVVPVKSENPERSAKQTQLKVRIGGRTVTAWPRPWSRWPTYTETGS